MPGAILIKTIGLIPILGKKFECGKILRPDWRVLWQGFKFYTFITN